MRIEGLEALVGFWQGSLDGGWKVANHLVRLVVNGDEAIVHFRSDLSLTGEGAVTLEPSAGAAGSPSPAPGRAGSAATPGADGGGCGAPWHHHL